MLDLNNVIARRRVDSAVAPARKPAMQAAVSPTWRGSGGGGSRGGTRAGKEAAAAAAGGVVAVNPRPLTLNPVPKS